MKMRHLAALLAVFAGVPALAQQAGGALGAIDRSVGGVNRGVNAEIGQSSSAAPNRSAAGAGKTQVGNASNAASKWRMDGRSPEVGPPGARLSTRSLPGKARAESGPAQQAATGGSAQKAAFKQQGSMNSPHTPVGIRGGNPGVGSVGGISESKFAFTGKASYQSGRKQKESRKKTHEKFANETRAHGGGVVSRRNGHFKQPLPKTIR